MTGLAGSSMERLSSVLHGSHIGTCTPGSATAVTGVRRHASCRRRAGLLCGERPLAVELLDEPARPNVLAHAFGRVRAQDAGHPSETIGHTCDDTEPCRPRRIEIGIATYTWSASTRRRGIRLVVAHCGLRVKMRTPRHSS